jgi:hypothetical protein
MYQQTITTFLWYNQDTPLDFMQADHVQSPNIPSF